MADDWERAVLPYVVLTLLRQQHAHGYALIEQMAARGLGSFKGGTIYPLLQRLEDQGLVGYQWEHPGSGPARKVFFLTDEGTEQCDQLARRWAEFSLAIDELRRAA